MLLFLDLETTGFDATEDAIIEIACARWDGKKITDRYHTLVQLPQGIEISPLVQRLTNITPEMCEKEGIPLHQALSELQAFLQDDDIITGHNIQFDTNFLKTKGLPLQQKEIDTFILSLLVLGNNEESHALEILAEKYGLMHDAPHRAMSDVEANIKLYELMEIVWAHNFSETFYNTLKQNTSFTHFPEQYFFDTVEKNKKYFLQQNIPQSKLYKHIQQWNIKKNDIKTLQSICKEKIENEGVLFWETKLPDRNIVPFVEWAEATGTPVAFVYPDDKVGVYKSLYFSMQHHLQFDEFRIFLSPPNRKLDEEKYNTFIQQHKNGFNSREEALVFVKTERAKELHQESSLRFMREELAIGKNLYTTNTNLSIPQEFGSIFVPFSHIENIPDNTLKIILTGENIEDLITTVYTHKIFVKGWKENNNRDTIHISDTNNRNIQLQKLFEKMSTLIRNEKKENIWTIQIPFKQAKYIQSFPDIWTQIKNLLEEDEQSDSPHIIQREEFQRFFSNTINSNFFFQIELFPDNELAFFALPIDITEYAQKILDTHTIVMGSTFPRKPDNTLTFSFSLPENSIDKPYPKEVFSDFQTPTEERTATPQELCIVANQFMQHNENIVISVNSKKVVENVTEEIQEFAKKQNYTILSQGSGSMGKMRVRIFDTTKKIVIATPRHLDILRVEDANFTKLIIAKPMFDAPKHPFLQERRKIFQNDFEAFSLPRAISRYEKELRRFEYLSSVFLGDGRVQNKTSWARVFWRGK